ncbi:hypothetical protein [Gulosibacter sp. 10]|uniref:hypothetical protein n=1 Tax=Gulosibacter sp. 10 TaxID=1255570 RepID=UPI00097EC3F4|nr:hypothetical protein [Gulosibacter sp. 10]SJM66093.1 hypothetical protein FM112_11485 [Gulosibacter sp. 10]
MRTARKTFAILLLWLPAAVIPVTWALWRSRLPRELPSHWSASGPADSATDGATLFAWLLGVALAAAAVGTALLLAPLKGKWTQRAIGGLAGSTVALVLGLWLMSTATALDVADPYTVELGPWIIPSMVAPLYGLLPVALLPKGDSPPVGVAEPERVEPLRLREGESVAWSRTISSWLFVAVAVLTLAIGVPSYLPAILDGGLRTVGWTIIPYLAGLLLVLLFCAYRVTVDWRGFRVTSMLLGIPLKRVAAEQLVEVEVATLEPMDWGGWGFRIMPGRSAIILRKGPGLVLTQADGRQFAITLKRPEQPASVLLGLIADEEGGSSGARGGASGG